MIKNIISVKIGMIYVTNNIQIIGIIYFMIQLIFNLVELIEINVNHLI